ncbi:hypothetical protein [Novosphingobium sp. MD-1]|uniref:hypothetical protein n=1 Tax=Novosphingobium sp. MD-1 TaxID=1630648 RepID=UPI00061C2FA3|nr:hypothetical protein [Novosphingobium sp. MD-1]GAO55235.1 hypothetical protein NMD1_02344 [Novosphingobium sp. MD-1]
MTDQAANECSCDLYDVLDHANNDELAPIVNLLIDSPFSYLKHARAYLRYSPDHGRYRDQIADDIYRLGFWLSAGLTTPSGSMDREKHSYADLLAIACKQIGIPVAGLDVAQREAMLVNVFARQHLLTAEPADRAALVSEAAKAAGKAASGVMSTNAWLPFVSALVEISYLRGIMTADGRLVDAVGTAEATVPARRVEYGNAVSIVGDDGQHAFSLATVPQDHAEGWSFIVPDGRTISKLTPFIQALQPFFNAEQMLAGKHIYSSEVALSWSDKVGGFVGVAKGNKGMADLQQVAAIGISGPAILLTAATAIAQQQQMQRIEEGLDEIKAMLAEVSRFQQDERHSILTGAIRYFRQIARAVLSGELAPEVLHSIENHEAELIKIHDHLVKDLRAATEALRAIKKDTFGSSKYVKALQEAQATVMSRYDEILLCLRARACGFQLMSAYPGRETGKQARFDAIAEDFRPFLPDGEATATIDRVLREKLQAISSYESKMALLASENTLFDNIVRGDRAIMAAMKPALSIEAQSSDAVVIDFQIEAGEVVGVRMG